MYTLTVGLDNAILGFLNADERKVDGARIAQLLAHGAHVLAAPEEETVKDGEAFASEVQILPGTTGHPILMWHTNSLGVSEHVVSLMGADCTATGGKVGSVETWWIAIHE